MGFEAFIVGKQLPKTALKLLENYYGKAGCLFLFDASYSLFIFLPDLKDEEISLYKQEIEFSVYKKENIGTTLIKFAEQDFSLLELLHDPRRNFAVENLNIMLTANLMDIYLIESTTMELKSARLISLPKEYLNVIRPIFKYGIENESYTVEYNSFIEECSNLSLLDMWQDGIYCGKIDRLGLT